MTRAVHHKALSLSASELKFDDASRSFAGYASVFNGVDAYGDTILPGAYAHTLENRSRPIRMRWNHTGPVIGRWTVLREDEKGLWVEGQLTPGHSVAEDAYASLKHGAVDGLSIGYLIPPGGAEEKDGTRYLKSIELVEISVVEEPADAGALVANVKQVDPTSPRELERGLRDLGLSKREAKRLMAGGFSALSDEDEEAAEIAAALRELNNELRV
ncbi:HK97 family phage prohead protease [Thioalkalivibrio sp. ALJ15]|uniref:HK97 family phage prohead protease n=1 Tax=Thioalkalivibrio sp. ALJ15 TaxID=748652 RepID=UPI00036E3A78|nr:HK97 family phage prohead protease [Thioalkalivibrio sp. ALJ15]